MRRPSQPYGKMKSIILDKNLCYATNNARFTMRILRLGQADDDDAREKEKAAGGVREISISISIYLSHIG